VFGAVTRKRTYPIWMADDRFKKRQKEPNSYQAQQAAQHANMLRLRAERLAREAISATERAEPKKASRKK